MQQKPVTILVGPARKPYFVFKDLLAAKSPYFAAQFKDCWDGQKDEVELADADELGFEVVMDWMHLEKLPTRLTTYEKGSYIWALTSITYKLADKLMIIELQNELLKNEVAVFRDLGMFWGFDRLVHFHNCGLAHTAYYRLCVKTAVQRFMEPGRRWKTDHPCEGIPSLKDHGHVAVDVLESIQKWNVKPWGDPQKEDLTGFMVQND